MAPADIEWVFGIVRAGREYQGMEHAKAGGAGYEFTATVIVRGKTAEIVGGAGRLTPVLAKEIEVCLHSQGITTAVWERFNGDPKRIVREMRGRSRKEDPGHADVAGHMTGPPHEEHTLGYSPRSGNMGGHASHAPSATHGGAHGGMQGVAAAFSGGFHTEVESIRAVASGGFSCDMPRTVNQKVGTG